ncbi:N-acetylneuraminate synthase family protein [Gammaproteobacteria bacterium]|nr:N-acetylneuraminate synthase family protein [Gammaproteobacteria bacterium]
MNKYIQSLVDQGKLDLVLDKKRWKFGDSPYIISGPCSVESEEMIVDWAIKLKHLGVDALRGGAFKPCTYPVKDAVGKWKEGLREDGLRYLISAREESGLPIVSEIMDPRQINELTMDAIDVIQVGTRNFQNYSLLDELGKLDKVILLKRGTWGTIDEILGAIERILHGGNQKVAICLRGVVGMPSYRHVFPSTRWAPDLMMIPALKELCDIPIIYDPSHATGYRNFVAPISRAAMALNADGLTIESHPHPEQSISDPDQAISIETLSQILASIKKND